MKLPHWVVIALLGLSALLVFYTGGQVVWLKWREYQRVESLRRIIETEEYTELGPSPDHVQRFGGAAAVPVLIDALEHKHREIRNRSAALLGLIGPDARAAVPALIERLDDRDILVRIHAAEALWLIDRNDEAKLRLISWLDDEHNLSVPLIIEYLEMMGSDAREATPTLVHFLYHENPAVRMQAAKSLLKIDPDAAARAGVR
jgi:hypothetical protein